MQNYHVDNPAAMSEGRHMINPTKETKRMNEVNHAAAKSNADFLKTVSTMRDIFGIVQANVAPAFGGQSLIIKTNQDFATLSALLSPTK
jgi:hypothetical protein